METEEQKKAREAKELKFIKSKYGEDFSHFCKSKLQQILAYPGLLTEVITSTFAPNNELYKDIILLYSISLEEEREDAEEKAKSFLVDYFLKIASGISVKKYGYDAFYHETKEVNKSVRELLAEKGYELFECHSEKEIQKFKKYYEKEEELCTFNGGRLERCHVFWIVKKNVKEIKRPDKPQREDDYGTSVLSIQFDRFTGRTEIICRYNHTISGPNNTYNNNLDEINEGLTQAFKKEYGFKIADPKNVEEMLLDNLYIKADDGKLYKYNYIINNIYYCPNNIIIDNGKVIDLNKIQLNRFILIDYFIFDKQERKMYPYDKSLIDSFIDGFDEILKPKQDQNGKLQKPKINDSVDKKTGIRTIIIKAVDQTEVVIKLDEKGRIVGYKNDKLKEIGDCFLWYNYTMEEIDIPNVTKIGDFFLQRGVSIKKINLPNVEVIGNRFLENSYLLSKLHMPRLRKVGFSFLCQNEELVELDLPNLEEVGDNFIMQNVLIYKLNLPKLKKVASNFLRNNIFLTEVDLPSLEKVESWFMSNNTGITNFKAPKLTEVGGYFLGNNRRLKELNLPSLEKLDYNFLEKNQDLISFDLPKLDDEYKKYTQKKLSKIVRKNLLHKKRELLLQRITNLKIFKIIKNKIKLIKRKEPLIVKEGDYNEKTTDSKSR